MDKKENRRITITKQMIKSAFVEMLEKEDIHKISIRALCESADVNRSTFYKYYGSQYDILTEMENDFLEEIKKGVSFKTITDTDEYLTNTLTFLKNNKFMCKILISDKANTDFKNAVFSLPFVSENLRKDAKSYSTEEFDFFLNFITQGMYGLITKWVENDCSEEPKFIASLIIKLLEKLV